MHSAQKRPPGNACEGECRGAAPRADYCEMLGGGLAGEPKAGPFPVKKQAGGRARGKGRRQDARPRGVST
jgi:hypothetical protein